jgi:hypothetical protein
MYRRNGCIRDKSTTVGMYVLPSVCGLVVQQYSNTVATAATSAFAPRLGYAAPCTESLDSTGTILLWFSRGGSGRRVVVLGSCRAAAPTIVRVLNSINMDAVMAPGPAETHRRWSRATSSSRGTIPQEMFQLLT